MFKHFRDRMALSGFVVLMIGIGLLIFTFISAFGFLTQEIEILASADLIRTFGEALAPLIATCIHIMYLGIMGWIGSLVTIRGVSIVVNAPKMETPVATSKPTTVPQIQTQTQPPKPVLETSKPSVPLVKESKPEVKPPPPLQTKPYEPEIIVVPPEQQIVPSKPEQKPPEKPAESQQPTT